MLGLSGLISLQRLPAALAIAFLVVAPLAEARPKRLVALVAGLRAWVPGAIPAPPGPVVAMSVSIFGAVAILPCGGLGVPL